MGEFRTNIPVDFKNKPVTPTGNPGQSIAHSATI